MDAVIKNGWIVGELFGIPVERDEITRPKGSNGKPKPYLTMQNTHKGVLHTTQGHSLKVASDTLHAKYAAPLLTLGEMMILQHRPFGVQQAALLDDPRHLTNSLAYVQIEMLGFTGGEAAAKDENHHAMDSWYLDDSTAIPAAAALAFLDQQNIIPLQKMFPFRDDCKDMTGTPATASNSYRKQARYLDPKLWGWCYHLHVPFNTHYDCGCLRFEELVKAARALQAGEVPAVVPPPVVIVPPAIVPPPRIHTVKQGESFYKIAGIYGVNPNVLAQRNNMTFKTVLKPGQLLTIPQ